MKIGDDEFERIYRSYYSRIWRYYRSCRVADGEAHDYAQEAFTRFFEKRHQMRGEEPWAFVQTIARRILLNKIRDQKAAKRSAKTVDLDAPEVGEIAAPAEPDYAERQQDEMQRRSLHAEIERLPISQRQAMRRYLADDKLEEIAQRLGISVDAVKSRLRDARRQLRARLGTELFPEDEE